MIYPDINGDDIVED